MQTPEDTGLMVERGKALHRQGRLEEATSIYRQVLESHPDNADALHLLGVVANQRGNYQEAASLIGKAVLLKHDAEHFHSNLGLALMGMGDLDGARLHFRAELERYPSNQASLLNLGALLQKQGKHEQAVEYYRAALAMQPADVVTLNNLGYAQIELRQFDAAEETALNSLQIEARNPDALNLLGLLSKHKERYEESLEYFKQALLLRLNSPEIYYNMGAAYSKSGNLEQAITCWQRTLALDEAYADAHRDLGFAYLLLANADEAKSHIERAVGLEPDRYLNRMTLLFYMHCHPDVAASDLAAMHRDFGERYETPLRGAWHKHANDPNPDRRLRVGFVSGDFKGHPVGYFMADVLVSLRSMGLELYAYANQLEHDALTERIQAQFAVWRECAKLDDDMLASQIRADGIDILVDLSGHTTDNRLLVFARKPAPVQVSYLGYFDTTGLKAMDYILGNRWVLPEREAHLYTERAWWLPDAHLCLTPPHVEVEVRDLPALKQGGVTFGCFNKTEKVNVRVIKCWAKILNSVPGSRLFLKNKPYGDAAVANRCRALFAEHGIESERLIFEGQSSFRDYLDSYNKIDISLDPYPYNGGTTTVQSLWMGVPVLALHGDRYAAHMSESILHSVSLTEWIAGDEDDYVAKASSYAKDLTMLAGLRAGLRERLLASPICDAPGFAQKLEAAFRGMWRQWCTEQAN